jgi:hypothetical protein
MRKPAKPSLNANPYILFAFNDDFEEICRLARTGHREREGQLLYEPGEIVPRPRRRKAGQEQRKPKSQLRTFADDPRLTKKERNQILAHADSLKKADATFKKILARIPTDLADPLVGCVSDMAEATLAIGELNPSPILRRLGTAEATASRNHTASERTDEIIRELAEPFMTRQRKLTANGIATKIHANVNKRLAAEGFNPLKVGTIGERLRKLERD